ncbi:cyclase family protein [Leptobacterium flavescens]|uniref:Cyclase family protein n=1 Tax=Leptobacterium flavescens TaxID=472055 RepID=A0A6P0ULK6_9FLAO|nr:cyclase family protein [Leptobacterium flavescens]NER12779.1 cyclase family protein [Leptobacterium flavescens]
MLATLLYEGEEYKIDLSKPLDISMPLRGGDKNITSWYLPRPEIKPAEVDGFVVSIADGAAVNSNSVFFNPHAHGTHTECVGHITREFYSINRQLQQYFFKTELITVAPGRVGDDFVISKKQIEQLLGTKRPQALVIRTIPNDKDKCNKDYSHTNPPYLLEEAAVFIREIGVEHLLIDLPSVDKEKDDGLLLAHKAFWNCPDKLRLGATITEFIFVPNKISDGSYFLNLQVAPFDNDATPSKPVLYRINDKISL